MSEPAFIYFLANQANTALHIGSVPFARLYVWYQRVKYQSKTFEAPYVFEKLVYTEVFENAAAALKREKELKTFSRIKQRKLVAENNAQWENLLEKFVQEMETRHPVS